jgi:DNA helicase II / ATP-dependent DNA helicase PcrA
LVDEYQDTNGVQYRLLKLLAQKYRNICVVGDEDQSIYKWRGADIRNILDFEKDYTETKTVKLEENYRSTSNIISASNLVISNNTQRKEKKTFYQQP